MRTSHFTPISFISIVFGSQTELASAIIKAEEDARIIEQADKDIAELKSIIDESEKTTSLNVIYQQTKIGAHANAKKCEIDDTISHFSH